MHDEVFGDVRGILALPTLLLLLGQGVRLALLWLTDKAEECSEDVLISQVSGESRFSQAGVTTLVAIKHFMIPASTLAGYVFSSLARSAFKK